MPQNLATEYISSDLLTRKILQFLGLMASLDEEVGELLEKPFFETIVKGMRVFKYNQDIHEEIFKALCQFKYNLN